MTTAEFAIPLSTRERDPGDRKLTEPPAETVEESTRNPDGSPNARGWLKIGSFFRKPMPVKQRPGRGTAKFDYITARQVAERLDNVVGPGNWQTAFKVLDVEKAIVECTLSVYGVCKSDVGYSNNHDAEHETEPLKASYSDAFKRAAVQFGIGRWLYGDV